MSISCRDFYTFSDNLAKTCATEAEFRAVASRAYYAAFHHALKFFEDTYGTALPHEEKKGMHERLINHLKNPTCTDIKLRAKSQNLGEKLLKVKLCRVNADYKIVRTFSKTEALMQLAEVRRILDI